MPQVSARIVIAQTGNPAPGGYSSGSRDNLLLNALVTLTNLDNTGATSWTWEVFPAVGLTEGDYSVSGKESASCTLTPPADTGFGDLCVRLTVRGDPLPNGQPNVAVAEALLGVRATLSGYDDGLPIVHPKESTLGGKLTLSLLRGAIGRIAEAIRAFKTAGVGGGGPPSGAAGGDLGGTYPNPTVTKLRTVPLAEEVEDAADTGNRILLSSNPGGDPGTGSLTLLPAPSQDQLLVFQDGTGIFWAEAPELDVTVYLTQYLGHPIRGLNFGASSIPIGGSGTVALTTGQCQGHVIRFIGALTGDRTVTLPHQSNGAAGRVHTLVNATTGAYLLRVEGYAGGFCYLLPGQSRRIVTDDQDVLRGEALDVLEIRETLSLVGLAGGDTLFSFRLPAMTSLDRCEIAGLVEPDGDGEYRASAGFGSAIGETYSDVVSFDYMPVPGAVRGLSSAEWGSAFTDGYSYGASARTLVFRLNAFNQTVAPTAGKIRIHAVARYLGE